MKAIRNTMVDCFLSWKLPRDFSPDNGITFAPGHTTQCSPLWPTGTNLLTADQAGAMVDCMLEGVGTQFGDKIFVLPAVVQFSVMPTPMKFSVQELRPEVLAFALLMEQRLREKDAEWGGNSWKDADIGNLQVCATAKIFSIETAILKGPEKDAIKHSVDLANYAMMIADVSGALAEAVEIINGEPQH
jgi:hypothetical protein